jgi:hypothetical protein
MEVFLFWLRGFETTTLPDISDSEIFSKKSQILTRMGNLDHF